MRVDAVLQPVRLALAPPIAVQQENAAVTAAGPQRYQILQ